MQKPRKAVLLKDVEIWSKGFQRLQWHQLLTLDLHLFAKATGTTNLLQLEGQRCGIILPTLCSRILFVSLLLKPTQSWQALASQQVANLSLKTMDSLPEGMGM